MKGRKEGHHKEHEHREGRDHRATGGTNDAEKDLADKPARYNQSRVEDEAEERRRGGEAKKKRARKHGGPVEHEKKHVGEVHGEHAPHRMDKKPRKNGGRTGADTAPYSSARYGKEAPGRTTDKEEC